VLCDDGGALEAATGLATQLCRNAPLAVRESRKVILEATYSADEFAWKRSSAAFASVAASADVQEGVAAFIEKREPIWQGK